MATKKTDFNSLNAELNQVLEVLQAEDIDVDQAVISYERGMQLIEQLEIQLKAAENKITKVKQQWNTVK